MATIRKRGSAWQAQVRRQGSTPISKSFATKTDAALWARDLERSIDRAELPANIRDLQRITLADLLARYEAEVTSRKRGADRERYKLRVIRSHTISAAPLSKLTASTLCSYRDDRLANVRAGTVRRELALLQHCLEIARREWGIPLLTNAVHGITLPRAARARDRRLKQGEEQRLCGAIRSHHAWYLAPLMQLAIETSMRRGELLSLLWTDVDLGKRTAHLSITKNGDARTVALSTEAVRILSSLHRSEARVFPISGNAVRLSWKRLRERAGLKDLRFHDLRHEAISRLFEIGLNVPEVATMSGHKDTRSLMKYTHIRPVFLAKKLSMLECRHIYPKD